MTRYRTPRFLLAGAAIALPLLLLGVAPALQDLIDRITALESESQVFNQQIGALANQVEILEGDSLALHNQIAVLEEGFRSEFVVLDSIGALVGVFIGEQDHLPAVMFSVEGMRPFLLLLNRNEFSSPSELYFSSVNCSGTPLMRPQPADQILAAVVYQPLPNETYIAPEAGTLTTVLSFLTTGGQCQNWNATQIFGSAILVPEIAEFVPPFRIVTRGDFQAMQEEN